MAILNLGVVICSLACLMNSVTAYKRVCYYSNWSQYRPGNGKFVPTDIDPNLCTHLIYSFAKLDSNYELATYEWNDETLYEQFNSLKQVSDLKTLIAVGGWNAGSKIFSTMVTNQSLRKKFSIKAVEFLIKYNFDGLDLDWEYPALRGGAASDKENFILLCEDLRQAMMDAGKPEFLLTAAVAAGKSNIDAAYDIPGMARNLDFINLMSYDLHGGWENFTGHNSPLYSRSSESEEQATLNVDWAAKYWVSGGVKPANLIIGLPTYGRHFKLDNPSSYEMGALASEAGTAGQFTREKGFLAYYEICSMLASGATPYWHDEHMVPYLVSGDQWVGYDDERSFEIKLKYIMDNNYGGAMVWNIDLDDFKEVCPMSNRKYPLMSLMKDVLEGEVSGTTSSPVTETDEPVVTETDVPVDTTTTDGPEVTETEGPVDTTTDEPEVTDKPTAGPSKEFSCAGRKGGYYPNTADCSKFYQCVNGLKYEFSCVPGLYWNQAKSVCDYPSAVECSESTQPTSTSQMTTESHSTQDATDAPTDKPTEKPTDAPTEEPKRTNPPQEFCVGKSDGLYPKEDNCAQYYNCGWERTYVMPCPYGLYYNPGGHNCDHESNVDCGSRPVVGDK